MRHNSDRRQALATHPATVPQNGPPALRGIAAQKPVLPFAANLGRLILSFHSSSVSPAREVRLGGVKARKLSETGTRENTSLRGSVKLAIGKILRSCA